MDFIHELKRRKVVRVAVAYAVAAWALVQVAATAFPLLHLPESYATIVLIAALIGFPVALVLAWAFDITPRGIQRTTDDDTTNVSWPVSWRITATLAAVLLIAAGAFATYRRLNNQTGTAASPANIRTIAVLPFRNLSNDPQQQYFSDGIAEELLNELARIPELNVVARTSSFTFREDSAEAQRQLKVQAVITGAVQRQDERVHITARLLDASTGTQLWSNSYDLQMAGVLDLQAKITREIVDALELQLRPGIHTPSPAGTHNSEALQAYLAGLSDWHERTDNSLRKALTEFGNASTADSKFAEAYAGTALTYAVLPLFSSAFPGAEAARRGKEAAQRALQLNPDLPEAHAALSQIALNLDLDIPTAAREARRAIELKPGYATAHQWYAEALQVQDKLADARRELETALVLDPVSPAARNIMGHQLSLEHRNDDAVAYLRQTLEMRPDFVTGRQVLALVLQGVERYEQALTEYKQFLPQREFQATEALLRGAIARRDGHTNAPEYKAAIAMLDGMERGSPPTIVAIFSEALHQDERTMRLLTRAVNDRQPVTTYFLIWPGFDRLRTRPDFAALMRKVRGE